MHARALSLYETPVAKKLIQLARTTWSVLCGVRQLNENLVDGCLFGQVGSNSSGTVSSV